MAKVTPKIAVKPLAAGVTPKADPKAQAAAAKEARLSVIASLVADVSESAGAIVEASQGLRDSFLAMVDQITVLKEEHDLTKDEAQSLIRAAFAEAGGFDVSELEKGKESLTGPHKNEYVYSSRVLGLAFPKEGQEKHLAKVRKQLEKGENIPLSAIEAVAKGKANTATPSAATKGRPTAAAAAKKDVFETEDDLGNAIAAIISKARKSDMDLDTVEAKMIESIEAYREAEEKGEEAATE